MKVAIYTKSLFDYFIKHTKNVINKLSINKFYKPNCKILEIEELDKKLSVTVDNDGDKSELEIPKEILGTPRDEDIFVSELINK
ncbi:MAG: hypothetical protein J1F35_08215 [Erysipelotrichales bacterium]|nr:hypothetical protein [Erysipelotrichales bacterium]